MDVKGLVMQPSSCQKKNTNKQNKINIIICTLNYEKVALFPNNHSLVGMKGFTLNLVQDFWTLIVFPSKIDGK